MTNQYKKATKRILSGAGANLIAQIFNTGIQLGSLPIFLIYWSLNEYGTWIMLSTVPAYISLSDFGVVSVTSNLMVMSTSKGDHEESVKIFKSGFIATTLSVVVLFILLCVFLIVAKKELSIADENLKTLFVLCIASFFGIYSGLIESIFRANKNFALGVNVATAIRMAEWATSIGFYFVEHSFFGVALGILAGRLISLTIACYYVFNIYPIYKLKKLTIDNIYIYKLFKKGIEFIAFPIGNAIQIQGFIMIAGVIFGPAYAAFFGVYRTISRSIVQLTAIFSRAIWPEITIAYAENDGKSVKNLVNKGTIISFLASMTVSLIILLFGEFIINKWTKNQVAYDWLFLMEILGLTMLSSVWQVPYVALMATNNTKNISKAYLLAAVTSVCVAYLLATDGYKDPLIISLGLFEIIMLASSLIFVKRMYIGIKNDF